MTLYAESAADQTDHFAYAFVCKNVANGYEVVTIFGRLLSKPFCLEKFSARKRRFQCKFVWNKVKYARITITHVLSLH